MQSSTGSNYVVRILSTLDREKLKPSSSVALHRHSNSLVDILPPEADSSIAMLGQDEKPDVTYADVGGLDMQKQEIREAVELVGPRIICIPNLPSWGKYPVELADCCSP